MLAEFVGRTCSSVRNVRYHFRDTPVEDVGAVEIGWADGGFTTLDVNSDWTLRLDERPWADPLANVAPLEREAVVFEIGSWELAPASADLCQIVGRTLTRWRPCFDEMGDMTGMDLTFGDLTLGARMWAGEMTARVTRS